MTTPRPGDAAMPAAVEEARREKLMAKTATTEMTRLERFDSDHAIRLELRAYRAAGWRLVAFFQAPIGTWRLGEAMDYLREQAAATGLELPSRVDMQPWRAVSQGAR